MSVRAVATRSIREGLPALSASVLGGLLAGVVLGGMRAQFEAVPGLLVLLPALLATRGNVYGSLGARLATGLHQGLVEPRVTGPDPRVYKAVAASIANGLLASAFAATAAFLLLSGLGGSPNLLVLVAVALLAGLLSGLVLSATVVILIFAGYRRGYNPDTLVGPVVTTAGDVFGVAFLLLAVETVLLVAGGS